MITLDTSAVLALIDEREPDHERVVAALRVEDPPFLVPWGIIAEVGYLVANRQGGAALDRFLADLEVSAFQLTCDEADIVRIRELTRVFSDLSLGVADAAVVACAERSGRRVMTLDRRDFDIVAGTTALTVLP